MGNALERMSVAELNKILHEVAHAISNITVIYGKTAEMEVPRPVPVLDLMHSTFQRGATLLRTYNGTEYRGLCIRRGDMRLAVAILKRSEEHTSELQSLRHLVCR